MKENPMKIRRFTLSVFALFSLALIFQSGTNAGMNQLQPVGKNQSQTEVAEIAVRDFLNELVEDRADKAVATLLEGSPLAQDAEKLKQLKEQIKRAKQLYGDFIQGEKIRIDRSGNSMIRTVHVLNCSRFPVIWRMMFYRSGPTEKWVVVSLRFDTDYENLPQAEPSLPLPLQ